MTAQVTGPIQGPKEKIELIKSIIAADIGTIRKHLQVISMMHRAFNGRDIDEKDHISKLIDVSEILERSRFPSMAIINFQVYCRLVSKYHPELESFKDWADIQAHALISYQGQNREEYVKMYAAQQGAGAAQTAINLMSPQQRALNEQAKKKHWWSRKPKQDGEIKID